MQTTVAVRQGAVPRLYRGRGDDRHKGVSSVFEPRQGNHYRLVMPVMFARFLNVISRLRSKANHRVFRSKPDAACSPNTDRLHRQRKSTPIAPICSSISVNIIDDCWRCRYPHRPLAFIRRQEDKKLSAATEAFVNEAATARRKIAISTISLGEVVYLIEKNRLPQSVYDELTQALADPEHVFTEAVFSAATVLAMRQVPRAEVPDMPDRMVAATAVYFDVPVIRRDRRIRAASLKTIW